VHHKKETMKTKKWAMGLVAASTLCAASGQIMIKKGITVIDMAVIGSVLTSGVEAGVLVSLIQVFAGYFLYAMAAAMLVVSLKHGELSVLYPIYAMNFVWVAIMSPVFFPLTDSMNAMKWAGVVAIVFGVTFISLGSKSGGGSGD